jgi:hypothetical protein
MLWKRSLILLLLLLSAAPLLAQDTSLSADISYGSVVEDTLTEEAFFDWWTIQAGAGDQMVVDMAASGGLEPLLGILDSGGTLVTRSEEGAPNSTITLEYTVPTAGQYIIVATRAGNQNGTSTGTYSLRVRRANAPVQTVNDLQDVTFRCESYEVTTAATLRFAEDRQPDLSHRVTVYGLDGFQPVIRFYTDQPQPFELCNTNADETIGDTFTLPGEEPRTITADQLDTVSQMVVSGAEEAGTLIFTIGSRDGAPGRYMAIIEGFSIEPRDDVDALDARIGPLAAQSTSLLVYMVAAPNSRLDPFMLLPGEETDLTCDDAGRRGCLDVLSFDGAGAVIHEGGGTELIGDRSDAGLLLTPGNPDSMVIELSSRDGRTHGGYALVVIGELPPRE